MIDRSSLNLQKPPGLSSTAAAATAARSGLLARAQASASTGPASADTSTAAVAAMLARALQRHLGLPATGTLYDASGRTAPRTAATQAPTTVSAGANGPAGTWSESDRVHELDATLEQQMLDRNRQLLAAVYNLLPKQAVEPTQQQPDKAGVSPPASDASVTTDGSGTTVAPSGSSGTTA